MNWQIGDLAIRVGLNKDGHSSILPLGSVYRVVGITPSRTWRSGEVAIGLVLENTPHPMNSNGHWCANRFRKIKPDTEPANADDAAWLKDMLGKPVRVGETAAIQATPIVPFTREFYLTSTKAEFEAACIEKHGCCDCDGCPKCEGES